MARYLRDRWPLLAARIYQVLSHERAQTLAEYGLIVSVVAVGVVLPTLMLFRAEIAATFNAATDCLNGSC